MNMFRACSGRPPLWIAPIVAAALTVACASNASLVGEWLDPETGMTVNFAETPLVLYRDNPGRAAYARNFVNIAPLRINRSGTYRYYLWLGIWHTIAPDDTAGHRDGFESIAVFADGEPLLLEISGWTPDTLGISAPVYTKPVASAVDAYYEVTSDQIRLIAAADEIRLRTTGAISRSYETWDSQTSARHSLERFVARMAP